MTDIHNKSELLALFNTKIIPQLLKELGKQVESIMKIELGKNNIKYQTMDQAGYSDYVMSKMQGTNACVVYIDYVAMENAESEQPQYMEWGRFTNTYDGKGGIYGGKLWNGMPITFRLAEWLENGGSGAIGNQPLKANAWFTDISNRVASQVNNLVKNALRKIGV